MNKRTVLTIIVVVMCYRVDVGLESIIYPFLFLAYLLVHRFMRYDTSKSEVRSRHVWRNYTHENNV